MPQGELTIINADGTIEQRSVTNVSFYAATRAALNDGWLETVPYFNRYEERSCVAFCDEEGKLKSLPVNEEATRLWHAQYPATEDVLVGPVVIVQGEAAFIRAL